MKNKVSFSIITPTYNRGELLKRCFSSLEKQTCMDFEWIIVDDGSTDDTESIVAGFMSTAPSMEICYLRKENGGKHTALNAAHSHIHGKYVFILDSDDELTEDAVAQALEGWSQWDACTEVGIVAFLRGRDLEHPCCYVKEEKVPVDITSYPRICPISSDVCEIIRTEIFLNYPFPVFPGERFLSEGVLWNRVGMAYKCVYINRIIYLCEYLEGGLTRSGRAMRIRNPHGGMCSSNLNMTKKNNLKRRIKNGLLFTCYGCFAKLSPLQMAQECDHKALMFLCLPFGWLIYQVWKRKYNGGAA
ncbi:MAG: glycosyltransferase family 2 protein [Ruminococcaceae bacterium]|jgi:glycosyltransferase involved in cell wall biosynthesis|nr:glycosyltransferase family 2 protein [Oscillospiraceae bacterium]